MSVPLKEEHAVICFPDSLPSSEYILSWFWSQLEKSNWCVCMTLFQGCDFVFVYYYYSTAKKEEKVTKTDKKGMIAPCALALK